MTMRRINAIDPTAATGSAKRLPEATSRRRFLGLGAQVVSYSGEPNPETFAKLNELIDGGSFELHIARTFKLEDAAEAQQALNDHYLGKLALVLS
jgi:NADPH:quinone reductase-like Zn-dependent oxidoreductase